MQYLNTIRPVHNGDVFSGTIRNLLPTYDGDVATFSGKAHVFEDNKGIVSRLFSYGIPVAEIAATPEGDKVVVLDYKKLISDNSPAKLRWSAVFKHIREFLHEHGISAEEPKDLEPFIVKEESVPAPAPANAESRIAHWVRNEHPRKPEEAWYTCSHCGKLALADGGNDILSDCCPHCGYEMGNKQKCPAYGWGENGLLSKNYNVEVQYTKGSSHKKILAFRDAFNKQPLIAEIQRGGKWVIPSSMYATTFYRAARNNTLRFVKPEEVESRA